MYLYIPLGVFLQSLHLKIGYYSATSSNKSRSMWSIKNYTEEFKLWQENKSTANAHLPMVGLFSLAINM